MSSVLILGAGINGAALARELALNGIGVIVVDTRDIAAGATAYSSRLIHGGLRYLEYGEFSLVRESLAERTRLLRLAPDFVRPLRLFIPVRNRFGGLMSATRRFIGLKDRPRPGKALHRGQWTVRFGLWLYDRYARDPTLPQHECHGLNDGGAPPVDQAKYRAVCSYSDAQIVFPERFTLALLADARQLAADRGSECRVFTYHQAELAGRKVTIRRVAINEIAHELQPSAIVNATGAWVDHTLQTLGIASKRLMGGTKGSHFVTGHSGLQQTLAGRAIYTEAGDGRPIFILPFVNGTLVGTTDEPFTGDPATAVATAPELEYLVAAVNDVFPDVSLTSADIDMHYAGVRPLPYSDATVPGAVTRRHWMEPNANCEIPLYSIIGGKLTTCRSLAEESTDTILARLGQKRIADSRERPIREMEPSLCAASDRMQQPPDLVRRVIRDEWVTTLDDLVERRLMLLYQQSLSRRQLMELADLLVEARLLAPDERDSAVAATTARLRTHFGKNVAS
jgi:glycerol-3-phosphate dehydrogenase